MKRSFRKQIGLWISAAILASATSSFSPLLAPPANDNFAAAINISSLPYTSSGINTTEATVESGKDLLLDKCNRNIGEHSVWYQYTPTVNEFVTLDTIGSEVTFDTIIAVYHNQSGILTLDACNDDGGGSRKSRISFIVLNRDTTYYFAASSYSGDIGQTCGVTATCDPGGVLVFNVNSNGEALQLFLPLIIR